MKIILSLCLITLFFNNCKRKHYGCICYHPTYTQDYGTHFTTKESQLNATCNSHKVDTNTNCSLITNY